MNPEKQIDTDEEKLTLEEQAINEPVNILEKTTELDTRTVYEKSNEELDELL